MSALFGLIRNLGHKAINAAFPSEKEQAKPKQPKQQQFKPKQPTTEDKIKKIMGVD